MIDYLFIRSEARSAPAKPWLTGAPFTQEDIARYNRLTHFPTTVEDMNHRFRQDVAAYEDRVRKLLGRYGVEGMPPDVKKALEKLRWAFYNWEIKRIRAREIAPPWTVVGRANYSKHANPDRADRMVERATREFNRAERELWRAVKRHAPNAPISSGDPMAVEKLRRRIEELKKKHEQMKEMNALYRRWKQDPQSVPKGLRESFARIAEKRRQEPWVKDVPYPSYALANSRDRIRRLERRLAELQVQRARPGGEEEFPGGRIVDNADDNRVQIVFDEKPPSEVRQALRQRGFRWSPRNGAWQRKRTERALQDARNIVTKYYGGED